MVRMLVVVTVMALCGLAASTFDVDLHNKFKTMPRHKFIEYFNRQNYTWKMTEYDFPEGAPSMGCRMMSRRNNTPAAKHLNVSFTDLPTNFDARAQWPQCPTIGEIYNQGQCGSCWTFGTATSASDRTCIHLNKIVRLSEEDYECCTTCFPAEVCRGGYPGPALQYWIDQGLVTQACKPYNIPELKSKTCVQQCVDSNIDYASDKHHGKSYGVLSGKENEIKAELFKNGPIEAGFKVYEDFQDYRGGIYVHQFGDLLGGHSVRVIGYGEESGVKYWLAANSWGTIWGDQGLFKIKAYQDEVAFENDMNVPYP